MAEERLKPPGAPERTDPSKAIASGGVPPLPASEGVQAAKPTETLIDRFMAFMGLVKTGQIRLFLYSKIGEVELSPSVRESISALIEERKEVGAGRPRHWVGKCEGRAKRLGFEYIDNLVLTKKEDGEEVTVGCLPFVVKTDKPKDAVIDGIYVRPVFHGEGWSPMLYLALAPLLLDRGVEYIVIGADHPTNPSPENQGLIQSFIKRWPAPVEVEVVGPVKAEASTPVGVDASKPVGAETGTQVGVEAAKHVEEAVRYTKKKIHYTRQDLKWHVTDPDSRNEVTDDKLTLVIARARFNLNDVKGLVELMKQA